MNTSYEAILKIIRVDFNRAGPNISLGKPVLVAKMSTRSERDRQKSLQERHQNILGQLLKEEDNKYCVDCDAKGELSFLSNSVHCLTGGNYVNGKDTPTSFFF